MTLEIISLLEKLAMTHCARQYEIKKYVLLLSPAEFKVDESFELRNVFSKNEYLADKTTVFSLMQNANFEQ